jgi:pyruvate/2-oxoglutarate dehydrogenase complex dihydrolipoamide acyltransferase (E2) component
MDVLMPQLGETVAEGKITKWFRSAGDAVKPGDNLFEIETDKVSMEVPSTTTGVLAEIRVAAGEVALVGAVVAVIADGAGAGATPAVPAPVPSAMHRPGSSAGPASPHLRGGWRPSVASISPPSRRRVRRAAFSRATSRRRRVPPRPRLRQEQAPRRSRPSIATCPSRKCRSMPCAGRWRRGF